VENNKKNKATTKVRKLKDPERKKLRRKKKSQGYKSNQEQG